MLIKEKKKKDIISVFVFFFFLLKIRKNLKQISARSTIIDRERGLVFNGALT